MAANAVALLLAYILPRVFTLASVVVAARHLGPGAFGTYGTAAAYAVLLSILATLGMQPLLIREIAREPARARRLLWAAHLVKTGSNALMLAALVALSAWVLPDPTARRAALVLGVGYAMGAYAENLAAWFQAVERMERWTQASAIFGLVSGTVGVALLLSTDSLVAFCWGPAVGWTAALAWLLARAPRDVTGQPALRWVDVRALLTGLAPFAAAFVGLTVYSKVDVLVLARIRGEVEVGVYTAAYKFVDIFQALVIVAAGAVYPRLSRAARGRRAGPGWAGGRSTELILLAAVPVGVALYLSAAPITAAFFGADYAASVPSLRVLALLLPLLAVSIHGGYVLGAAGRMAPVAAAYGVGIVLNVGLNLALVPGMGARGAALARLGSEVVVAAALLWALAVAAGAAPRGRTLAVACGAALGGALVTLLPDPTGGWLRASAAVVVGLALYAAVGVITPAERAALRGLVGRSAAGGDGG